MLRLVRIPGPEHHSERPPARSKPRKNGFGERVHQPLLVRCVGRERARCCVVARRLIPRWRTRGQAGGFDRRCRFRTQRQPFLGADGRVDDDRRRLSEMPVLGRKLGQILNGGRSKLSDGRGVVSASPRRRQQRLFLQVVAADVIVQIAKHLIVFDRRRQRSGGAAEVSSVEDRKARKNIIRELARIARQMARRNRRCVGHRESWKDGMTVGEIHAVGADVPQRRRVRGIHRPVPEAVSNKDDDVALPRRRSLCGQKRHKWNGERESEEASFSQGVRKSVAAARRSGRALPATRVSGRPSS